MRIAIYTRKSVYVENSESIETQITLCKQYFKGDNEFEVFEDEGFSGKNTKRPAFQKMIRLIKMKKFDTVAVYKVDRIARNIVDFVNVFDSFDKLGVALVSITEGFDATTPIGKMMMMLLASFAEMERMNISQRVTDNLLQLAKKGCFTGGQCPAGYEVEKIEGKSYLKLSNGEFIKEAYETYIKVQSLYMAHKLLRDKYPSLTPAHKENLRKILRSPIYVKSDKLVSEYLKLNDCDIIGVENKKGYTIYGQINKEKIAIVSKHEAVITPSLWLEVNKLLDSRAESAFKKDSKTYWLSGVLKCPSCGAHYVLTGSTGRSYYVCSNRLFYKKHGVNQCSNSKYVKCEHIENEVEIFLKQINTKEEFLKQYDEISDKSPKIDYKIFEKDVAVNVRKIKNLAEELEDMSKEARKPIKIRIEELTRINIELESKIEELKMIELDNKPKNIDIFGTITDFNKTYTGTEKRIKIRKIFSSIFYDGTKDHADFEFV